LNKYKFSWTNVNVICCGSSDTCKYCAYVLHLISFYMDRQWVYFAWQNIKYFIIYIKLINVYFILTTNAHFFIILKGSYNVLSFKISWRIYWKLLHANNCFGKRWDVSVVKSTNFIKSCAKVDKSYLSRPMNLCRVLELFSKKSHI